METESEVEPRRRFSTWRFSLIFQSITLATTLILGGMNVFIHYVTLKSLTSLPLQLLLVLLGIFWILIGIAAFIFWVLIACDRSTRKRKFVNLAVACTVYCMLYWIAGSISQHVRFKVLEGVAQRSKPLIQAIHDYETDHGTPPNQLSDLVPAYLPQVPSPGLSPQLPYWYETKAQQRLLWSVNHDFRWTVYVVSPKNFMENDVFIFLPTQRYQSLRVPSNRKRYVKIGDWAYVPEWGSIFERFP